MRFVNCPQKLRRFCFNFTVFFLFIVSITVGTIVSSASNNKELSKPETAQNSTGWFGSLTEKFAVFFSGAPADVKLQNQEQTTRIETADSPIFAEFDAWIRAYADNNFKAENEQSAVGENLASKRLELLKELMRADPQTALAKAIPAEIFHRLPSNITEHSEKRISANADFLVYTVDEFDRATGQMTTSRTDRFVVIEGKRYEALVYGRRESMTTKYDIPIQGIVIGDTIVLDENPARKINSDEYAAQKVNESALGAEGVAAEIGGKIFYFANQTDFDNFIREQTEWEAKIGPKRSAEKAAPDSAAPESSWTEGLKTVLVIRVDFSDKPGEPLDHYNQPLTVTRAQTLFSTEVSPFYVNNSYSKTSMAATVTTVLRMPQTQAYYALGYYNTLLADAETAAANAGLNPNNFDLDLVTFSYTPSIGWAGIAAIGARGAMLNGAFYMPETAHELGHCYGLLHANLWRTVDGSVIGAGNNVEYGDCYDNMGACVNGNATRHFNARYKRLLDWITSAEAQTVTSSGVYRIYAQDSILPAGIRTLKIPKNTSKNYWVEFRQLQTSNPNAMNGALIRWDYSSQSFRETQLLDMNPSTSSTSDAPLNVGQSFYDSENQIRITVVGKGNTVPESLDVRVEFGSSTPTPTPTPTATPTPTPTATPTPACSYSISPPSTNFSASGGNGSFVVTANNVNCTWTATSNAPWIILTNGSNGSGNGTAQFFVNPNPGSIRTGTISISGNIFSVTQAAATIPAVRRPAFDFDGDGKADPSVYRATEGVWYLQNSSSGFSGMQFGIGTDKIVPGDYDGDGKTDIAVFRSGNWYLQRSRDGFIGIGFGTTGDLPLQTDFDGDGRAELTVFRPSTGATYSLNLANNQFRASTFGLATDKFVPADYDGDGKTDEAVFRAGTWHIMQSSSGQYRGELFGQIGDVPVAADYDGDGKADLAVFRAGTWYIMRSRDGFTGVQFGLITDKPIPADYDGDGKADIAVFRDGFWYILQSSNGQFRGLQFGSPTDQPTPFAFLQ